MAQQLVFSFVHFLSSFLYFSSISFLLTILKKCEQYSFIKSCWEKQSKKITFNYIFFENLFETSFLCFVFFCLPSFSFLTMFRLLLTISMAVIHSECLPKDFSVSPSEKSRLRISEDIRCKKMVVLDGHSTM